MGKLLTAKETAAYLRINQQTVYQWMKQGRLPGVRVGKFWRFDEEQLAKLMQPISDGKE